MVLCFLPVDGFPLDATACRAMPAVPFNGLLHRLTSPVVWTIHEFLFRRDLPEVCFLSGGRFHRKVRERPIRDITRGLRFLWHPLPAGLFPSLAGRIPPRPWRRPTGLPSSPVPTFNGAFREALFAGRMKGDAMVNPKHHRQATYHFGAGVSVTIFAGSISRRLRRLRT